MFASSNAALMLAQLGDEEGAVREMQAIARWVVRMGWCAWGGAHGMACMGWRLWDSQPGMCADWWSGSPWHAGRRQAPTHLPASQPSPCLAIPMSCLPVADCRKAPGSVDMRAALAALYWRQASTALLKGLEQLVDGFRVQLPCHPQRPSVDARIYSPVNGRENTQCISSNQLPPRQ